MAKEASQEFLNHIGNESQYDFNYPESYVFKSRKGLDEEVIHQISHLKNEPKWMLDFRLKAYKHYLQRPILNGGQI